MFYSIGDEMRAVLNGNAGKFSIPQADLNGFCSDYYSASFMESERRNFCTREIDLSSDSDCRNLLDYKVWVDSL